MNQSEKTLYEWILCNTLLLDVIIEDLWARLLCRLEVRGSCLLYVFVHWKKMNGIILIWAEHIVAVQTDPGGNSYAPFTSVFNRQLEFAPNSSLPLAVV